MPKNSFANTTRSCLKTFYLIALLAPVAIVGCGKSSAPDASASAAPSTGASTDAPAGYNVVLALDSGKSLVTQKANVATVDAALLATFPDLAAYFGNQPTIGSAFQDAHDATIGGATFSATYSNQPIRGIVSCKLQNGGASVGVIFDRTDAPKSDWDKLMAPPAPQAAAAPSAPAPAADSPASNVALTEYDFPDGTGSIGIAAGWTIKAQSEVSPGAIIGPAGQAIFLDNSVNVQTPDSPAVANQQRIAAQWAQMDANSEARGLQPIPHKPLPPLMVAPFTDPATAVQNMMPSFSARSVFNNGPSLTFGRIISSQDTASPLPNSKRAQIIYSYTQTNNGQSTPYRAQIVLVVAPIQNSTTTWMWFTPYAANAPDATFDQDLPVMMAMVNSNKINQAKAIAVGQANNQALYQAGQQMIAANNAQAQAINNMYKQDAETQQNIHDQQQAQVQAGYDAHNQQFAADQLQRSRSAADFDESILGTRTIYDTVTGQSGYANLTDVSGVVDSLNQAALDPNRFVQIPLRDQLYPLPKGN
jgi:hypothetical protein